MFINSGSDFQTERALGINWDIENGKLGFKVNLGDKPYTRRGMLSMMLKGKMILQELCKNNFSSDEQVLADNRRMGAMQK